MPDGAGRGGVAPGRRRRMGRVRRGAVDRRRLRIAHRPRRQGPSRARGATLHAVLDLQDPQRADLAAGGRRHPRELDDAVGPGARSEAGLLAGVLGPRSGPGERHPQLRGLVLPRAGAARRRGADGERGPQAALRQCGHQRRRRRGSFLAVRNAGHLGRRAGGVPAPLPRRRAGFRSAVHGGRRARDRARAWRRLRLERQDRRLQGGGGNVHRVAGGLRRERDGRGHLRRQRRGLDLRRGRRGPDAPGP